jgi:hypothetical protein
MGIEMLLTREEFEKRVFERDRDRCVICGAPAWNAHHLIERKLWTEPDQLGGYLMENGVSVCAAHHEEAERNLIPPQVFRKILGLPTMIPASLHPKYDHSKWGIPFRMPAREAVKYPSTSYLDVSPGQHGGNEVIPAAEFEDVPFVITIKMDGANVVLRRNSMGARNGDTANHESFDMLKALHAGFRHQIPEDIEIFGEWLYAKHSIHYTGRLALSSYLQIIAAYDMKWRLWLSWNDTVKLADAIGYPTVPVLCTGIYAGWQVLGRVTGLGTDVIQNGHEGIVIRSTYPFHYGQFGTFVGKYVRDNHVQTDDHWLTGPIVKNEVKK